MVGIIAATCAFGLVGASYQGLMSLIGQEKLMAGRMSTLWNIVASVPVLLAAWSAGWVAEHLNSFQLFLLVAGLCLILGFIGLWKPKAVFGHAYDKPQAQHSTFFQDVRRLATHWAIYPVVMIHTLWNFSPASNTPLQFYLTNQLHLPDSAYANFTAIFVGSFIPMYFLYGYLCKRIALKHLLLWGTVIAVPQLIPLMFVHSALTTQLMAIPIGMMGGVATAAYYDLAMRSCPPGLQGTLMMIITGVAALSVRGGDVLGTTIFQFGGDKGFLYCVGATTLVYALLLVVLIFVPKHLTSTRDGEQNPEGDKLLLEEVRVSAS